METPTRTAPPVVLDRLVRLLLRWICRKLVKQGSLHKERIVAYYRIMREAAESEFTEDNKPTLDAFLGECHSEANDEMRDRHLKQPPPEEGNTQ